MPQPHSVESLGKCEFMRWRRWRRAGLGILGLGDSGSDGIGAVGVGLAPHACLGWTVAASNGRRSWVWNRGAIAQVVIKVSAWGGR